MAYLLDGLVLALFVLLTWLGHRNGFIKTAAGVVSFVVALMLATMLSGPVSEFAYDSFVEPTVVETLSAHVGEGSPAATQLDAALEGMPAFITNRLAANGMDSGAAMLANLSGAAEGETVPQSIARQVVQPVVAPLLKALCMLLLFLVFKIALTVILKVADLIAKLPLLKQINKTLGVVAGIVQGVLWAFFAVTVLQLLANAGWFGFLTPDVMDATVLVKWLDTINPMTSALRELIVF